MVGPSDSSLTRAKFAAALRAWNRRVMWGAAVALLGLIPVASGIMAIMSVMDRHGVSRDSFWRILVGGLLLVYLFGVIGLFDWLAHRSRLRCGGCRYPLLYTVQLALVTGRCPKCAHPIFVVDVQGAETFTQPPLESLISRSEFQAAESAAQRRALRPALMWAVGGALLLSIGATALAVLQPVLGISLGEMWTPFLLPVLLAPGIMVGFWAFVIFVRRDMQLRSRCPRCGETLSQYALHTGNCSTCGQPAISDPLPGLESRDAMSAEAGWSIADFHSLADDRSRRLWIGCLIGPAFLLPILLYFQARFDDALSQHSGIVVVVAFAAICIFQLTGVWWWHRRSARDLHCPDCHGELLQMHHLVISSHRCYRCGSVVFRNEPSTTMQRQGTG